MTPTHYEGTESLWPMVMVAGILWTIVITQLWKGK